MDWSLLLWLALAVLVGALIVMSMSSRARTGLLSFLSPLGAAWGKLAGSWGLKTLAIPLVVGMWFGLVECVKHQGRLEERLVQAEADKQVLAHERDVSDLAGKLGVETERARGQRDTIILEAEQELENAVEAGDFESLYANYLGAHCRLLPHPDCADSPDPAPPSAERVRGPRSHAA